MTIPEAIKKEIEAGWDERMEMPLADEWQKHPFLQPFFWQSLGNAMGWKDEMEVANGGAYGINGLKFYPGWKGHWHRFIDRLADGKTAEEFFASLEPGAADPHK